MRQEKPNRAETAKVPGETAKSAISGPQRFDRTETALPDEQALFGGGSGARLFGEGSYAEGGSNAEGNWEERDAHPHGSHGSFSDAGGFGATELLGDPGFGEARPPHSPDGRVEPAADSQKQDDRAKRR